MHNNNNNDNNNNNKIIIIIIITIIIIIIIIIIIGTSVCDKSHSLTNKSRVIAMAQWDNCALVI